MSEQITSIYQDIKKQIESARKTKQSLVIAGGDTKFFYGCKSTDDVIQTDQITGVIAYEPTELVITAYAGTRLHEINQTLAQHNQMLAFEPPSFGDQATIGGTVACGFSGPRRPFVGSARDFVLGMKCLNGKGEILSFGGQVMKNVAGYDVSRLMTGAMGTLGVLLEISIKVLPKPDYEITIAEKSDFISALDKMNRFAGRPLPISATCFDGNSLYFRLSGKKVAVQAAIEKTGLEEVDVNKEFWDQLREHQLEFFQDDGRKLWRISVPSMTPAINLAGDWLIEWCGVLRWLKSDEAADKVYQQVNLAGGHATLFRNTQRFTNVFQPLTLDLMNLHLRLKQKFDPDRILNRGRMYPDF